MEDKQQGLQEIRAIATRYALSLHDIQEAFEQDENLKNVSKSNIMQKIFSYIGGLFIFAGIGIYIAQKWIYMSTVEHLIVTLGTGFALYLLALLFMKDNRFAYAVTPLLLISAFLETSGLYVLLDEFSIGNHLHHGLLFVNVVMLAQQGFTFLATKRTVLAFNSLAFLSMTNATLLDWWNMDGDLISVLIGLSLIITAYRLAKSVHRPLAPFPYFFGSIFALAGTFELLRGTPIELLYLGMVSGFIYLSTVIFSRTLLFISCIAMLCYIGYFCEKHLTGGLGGFVFIILGFLMLGLGAFAFKLSKNMKASTSG